MKKLPNYMLVVASSVLYFGTLQAMPGGTTSNPLPADECFVWGDGLADAKGAFAEACPTASFRDCDPVADQWVCADVKVETIDQDRLVNGAANPLAEPDGDNDAGPVSDVAVGVCYSVAATLQAAKQAYAQQCPAKLADCDPVDGVWVCANTAVESIANLDSAKPVTPPAPDPEPTPDPDPLNNPAIDHTYAKNDGPYKNPLKGWNSGWDGGNDHPESSVGFQYIPWKDFEPVDGNFSRGAVEAIIDNEGSKNRHLVLRLYCDWHGANAESDCPNWMYSDAGVERLKGNNGRYITDFNDANYIAQAQQAIQALAAEYDDDPRIYAVQMGVIGYWGEWHTWGSDFNGDSYDITDETRNAILSAYQTNFDNARIMARYPWREPTQSASGIGYHNDYFVVNNGHSEEFDDAVAAGSQWMFNPIGGEVPPRGNGEANSEKADLFNGVTGQAIIETGHYSTMKAGAYRVTKGQSGYEGYMRLHKKMGYNYQIDVASFAENVSRSEQLAVELVGTNIGVAPMYFDWDVQFSLLDENDIPLVTEGSTNQLTSILPGAIFTFSSNVNLGGVNPGKYKLAVRIIQPDADLPKSNAWKLEARNTYILFSNDLPVVNGKWVNNRLVGGWSVLGNVTVK